MTDDASDNLDPEDVRAACFALSQLLHLLGAQKKSPSTLYALYAIVGATLLRFTDYTVGDLVDATLSDADNETLIVAITEVMREAGMLSDEEKAPPN